MATENKEKTPLSTEILKRATVNVTEAVKISGKRMAIRSAILGPVMCVILYFLSTFILPPFFLIPAILGVSVVLIVTVIKIKYGLEMRKGAIRNQKRAEDIRVYRRELKLIHNRLDEGWGKEASHFIFEGLDKYYVTPEELEKYYAGQEFYVMVFGDDPTRPLHIFLVDNYDWQP